MDKSPNGLTGKPQALAGAGPVAYGPDKQVPSRLTAEFHNEGLTVTLNIVVTHRGAEVRSVTVEGGGGPVTAEGLRRAVVLGAMRDEALQAASEPRHPHPDLPGVWTVTEGASEGYPEPTRTERPTERVRQAAEAYRKCVESGGREPVKAVMEALGLLDTQRPAASALVVRARRAGLLPPAQRRGPLPSRSQVEPGLADVPPAGARPGIEGQRIGQRLAQQTQHTDEENGAGQ